MKAKSNLLLLAGSLAVAVVVGEALLRVLGIAYPEFNRLDPVLGWKPIAGLSGTYMREGNSTVSINAEGFRDIDHPVEKPAGTLRIAVLGDSMTEAREVALADTFWKRLEVELARCPGAAGRAVEVFGFAVNGYGTAQELLMMRDHALKYRPDVVLLAVFTANDIWNNSARLDGHRDRPYFALADGELVAPDPAARGLRFRAKAAWIDVKHFVLNRLRTLQLVKEGYARLRLALARGERETAMLLVPGPDSAVYLPPADGAWEEAWALTEALIAEMNARAREAGAAFWLATLTNPIQAHPDTARRRAYARAIGADDLGYPDRRLAAFATANRIPAITLADKLVDAAEAAGTALHGFPGTPANGHWNETGHRLAGAALAAALCPALGAR